MLSILWTLALSAAPSEDVLHRVTANATLDRAELAQRQGDSAHAAYFYRLYMRQSVSSGDRLLIAEKVGEILFAQSTAGRGLLELEAPAAVLGKIDTKTYVAFPVVEFLEAGKHQLQLSFGTKTYQRTFSITAGRVTSLNIDPRLLPNDGAPVNQPGRNSLLAEAGQGGSASGWVVIAHRSTRGEISREQLRKLFGGERVVFEGGAISQVVLPPAGSRARSAFLADVLGKDEAGFRSSWAQPASTGVKPPIEAKSDQEVIELVAGRPGSFGVVGSDNDTTRVTRLFVR